MVKAQLAQASRTPKPLTGTHWVYWLVMKWVIVFSLLWAMAGPTDREAVREIMAWRAQQDRDMRGEKSPFGVESVQLLRRERNTIGRAADADIRLPAPGVPAVAAIALVRGQECVLQAQSPAVRVNGRPVTEHALKFTDRVAIGPYRLQFRRPDGKPALRISNLHSAALRAYTGLKYFPVDLKYRVPASFSPAAGAARMTVEATQGGPQELPLAGKLTFELEGRPFRLDAFVDEDEPDNLFVIFKDTTSGRETYPVGRYVYVPKSRTGESRVVLDFNKAFNPLCAYGPWFFCPIPPKQNHLPLAIPVGEKNYSAH